MYVLTRTPREATAPPVNTTTAPEPAPPPPVREAPPVAVAPPRPAPRRAPETKPEPASEPAAPAVEAAAPVAVLNIDSDVAGAQVFIDREFVGATPVTAASVKPGTHRINVSAKGYDGVAETVDVSAGSRDLMFRLRDVRLDLKLDVVHKHRMGSCKGRLVATPQGVSYETTDKDDAFQAALLDLETFDVDYLEKNLRVKPRKGRLFNFTDPEGNAD